MEYRIEKLTDENIGDLLPIYQSAFSTDVEFSELKAKFDTSYFGLKNVGFIKTSSSKTKTLSKRKVNFAPNQVDAFPPAVRSY